MYFEKKRLQFLVQIFVIYNGRDIPSSPYQVHVELPRADVSKVRASGPGLEDDVMVKKPTYFDIHAHGKFIQF